MFLVLQRVVNFVRLLRRVSGGMMCKDTFFKLKNQSYKMKIFTFYFFIDR